MLGLDRADAAKAAQRIEMNGFSRMTDGCRVFHLLVDPSAGGVLASEVTLEKSDEPIVVERQVVRVGGEVVSTMDVIRRPKPVVVEDPDEFEAAVDEAVGGTDPE